MKTQQCSSTNNANHCYSMREKEGERDRDRERQRIEASKIKRGEIREAGGFRNPECGERKDERERCTKMEDEGEKEKIEEK